jgi:hypothetical protein
VIGRYKIREKIGSGGGFDRFGERLPIWTNAFSGALSFSDPQNATSSRF